MTHYYHVTLITIILQ